MSAASTIVSPPPTTISANELLFMSINSNDETLFNRALDSGADVNCIVNGYSALHFAVINCTVGMIELLIKKGANVNVVTEDGPLLTFAKKWGHQEIIDVLVGALNA